MSSKPGSPSAIAGSARATTSPSIDALIGLAKIDPRQSRVVELRFFAGLSLEQISEVLEIAPATVQRDWTAARGNVQEFPRMSTERWERTKQFLEEALRGIVPEQRPAYLDLVCGADSELRRSGIADCFPHGGRQQVKLPDSLERTCLHLGPEAMTTKL